MDNKMFCFQCEQTALCTGCTGKAGVCGKTADVAKLQDELTGALVGLARAADNAPDVNGDTWRLMIEGLFTTVTNVNFNEETIRALIDRVRAEKARLVPDCAVCASACGRTDDYDMEKLWGAQEDIRSLKSLILFGVRGMAAYAHHAMVLGYTDEEVNHFLAKALFAVGEDWGMDELLPIVMEVGEKNLKCMALLDKANTESYGTPAPVTVPLTVEKGPFIVISGHDLHDLKLLLEQTDGKGINIYTHGEMLPAHGYPELKKYAHLKGNFGTAWQNQQKEFAALLYLARHPNRSVSAQELYEAAAVDGAGYFRRAIYITIPELMNTFIVLLLLFIANFINNGMDQYFAFRNTLVLDQIENLELYSYRLGLQLGDYSFATAVGIFKSVVSIALLFAANTFAKKVRGTPII